MRRDIVMTGALFALALGVLSAQGCAGQAPIESREVASSGQPERMLMCTDPNDTQCMVCDATTHQCHFPVFKLP
jgi:hypothetical protein